MRGAARRGAARRSHDGESGSVTAEFAAVVPAVMLMLALCLGALQLSTLRLTVQDAAAQAARSAARGGSFDAAALVEGAAARIDRRGNLVCATVTAPGALLVFGPIEVSASGCALAGGG